MHYQFLLVNYVVYVYLWGRYRPTPRNGPRRLKTDI
jgi:hypothetical protein